ncbi:hypothetical protein KIN20_029979 [Parelaphostrongylus tenuis]|uniref:Uncharacterized protein n=1 Tax=Parelaphostrongylus tenuis TaxID=148309 RepID=A0AAD5WG18_PARTN|nr:hypothetical protein KIN20_029979 [Parelaphostrongylus tenuis]
MGHVDVGTIRAYGRGALTTKPAVTAFSMAALSVAMVGAGIATAAGGAFSYTATPLMTLAAPLIVEKRSTLSTVHMYICEQAFMLVYKWM